MIGALEALAGFEPPADDLKIEALKTFAVQLRSLNNEVVPKYESQKRLGDERNTAFTELNGRSSRIKSNVQSIFGTASVEFRNVKGLRF